MYVTNIPCVWRGALDERAAVENPRLGVKSKVTPAECGATSRYPGCPTKPSHLKSIWRSNAMAMGDDY